MAQIKGWKKVRELVWRGDNRIIEIKKYGLSKKYNIFSSTGLAPSQQKLLSRKDYTKQKAKDFAIRYMKTHSRG